MYSVNFPIEGKSDAYGLDATKIGSGATGTIYAFDAFERKYAAKILKGISDQTREKIQTMISMSSVLRKDSETLFDQLAWPVGEIYNEGKIVGFAMPLFPESEFIPFESFFDYNLRDRLPSSDFTSISLLSDLVKKLAELLAFLHAEGIHVVDLKPQNIRVAKKDLSVFILDCDSFSFKSPLGRAFPAGFVSADYICPETIKKKLSPGDLGEGQDRYAFAVLAFQLLNRGIHPFQGVLLDESIDAPTNDQKAEFGLYAYGAVPHSKIAAHPRSVHKSWPKSLRSLFDLAFTAEDLSRPSLVNWRDYFASLAVEKKFKRCKQFPDDPKHIHFSEGECVECYLNTIKSIGEWKPAPDVSSKPLPSAPTTPSTPTQSTVTQKNENLIWYVIALIAVLVVFGGIANNTPSNSSPQRPPTNASSAAGGGSSIVPASPVARAGTNNTNQGAVQPRATAPQNIQPPIRAEITLTRSDMYRLRLALYRYFRKEEMPPSLNSVTGSLSSLPLDELRMLREFAQRFNITLSSGTPNRRVVDRLLSLPAQPITLSMPPISASTRNFTSWRSYSDGSNNNRCIVATTATQVSSDSMVFRPEIRGFSRVGGPATAMAWELSYPMPFRSWSPVNASIDGVNFRLFIEENSLKPPRTADGRGLDASVIRAMRAGRVMRISGINSLTHEPLWIEFSLLGFTRAFNDMMSRCNRQDLRVWIE